MTLRRIRAIDPAIVALAVLGIGVALLRVGSKSLWLDEAASVYAANLRLGPLWHLVTGGSHNQGLYYVLLHFWVAVFGDGATAVRSLGAIGAGLAVPVVAVLGKHLFGRTAGLVAGLLLALDPFFVQWAQTARSYGLVVLFVSLSSYSFVRALEQESRPVLVGYVLTTAPGIYLHYFTGLVVLVQLVTLIAVKRRAALRSPWPLHGRGTHRPVGARRRVRRARPQRRRRLDQDPRPRRPGRSSAHLLGRRPGVHVRPVRA